MGRRSTSGGGAADELLGDAAAGGGVDVVAGAAVAAPVGDGALAVDCGGAGVGSREVCDPVPCGLGGVVDCRGACPFVIGNRS